MERGWLVVVFAVLGVSAAHADAPNAVSDKLVAEGRALLERHEPKMACAKFEEAIRFAPMHVETMLELGRCNEELGKLATAQRWYRKAQSAAAETQRAELERTAQEHAVKLAPDIAAIRLDVAADVAIEIDGFAVEAATLGRVELDAGAHEVIARAPGKRDVHRSIQLRAGELQNVAIAVTAAAPQYRDPGRGVRHAGLIFGGAGLAGFVIVGIYGVVKRDQYNDPDLSRVEQDAAKVDLRVYGTTGLVLSTLALGTGVLLYVISADKVKITDHTALVPIVGDRSGGLALTGAF